MRGEKRWRYRLGRKGMWMIKKGREKVERGERIICSANQPTNQPTPCCPLSLVLVSVSLLISSAHVCAGLVIMKVSSRYRLFDLMFRLGYLSRPTRCLAFLSHFPMSFRPLITSCTVNFLVFPSKVLCVVNK